MREKPSHRSAPALASTRSGRDLRLKLPSAFRILLALPLLLPCAPAGAHGASAGDLPLTPEVIPLQHLRPAEAVALFAREQWPDPVLARVPRSARAGNAESLLPPGIDALLQTDSSGGVVAVGREDRLAELRDCLQVVDVPLERRGPNLVRVALTLSQASPQRVLRSVRELPERGTVSAKGLRVVLEGNPGWLHRALRQVIRAELKEPETGNRLIP